MRDLDIVKGSSLFTNEEFQTLQQLSEELADSMGKNQIFRTETEMRVSVLNQYKFPTIASKYWQAVREQSAMLSALVSDSFNYRKNEVKLKKLQRELSFTDDELDKEMLEIEIDQCLFQREQVKLVAKDRVREIRLWSQIKNEIDDGSFDNKNVDTHQLISYAQRFILEYAETSEHTTISDLNNIKGQLVSSIEEAQKRGVLHKVLENFNRDFINQVLVENKILRIGDEATKNIASK